MDRVKRIWYLSPMRAAKVQASLRIRAVSPEPSLLAHTNSESRGTFRQKARSLAPLNVWACTVKIYHDGMLEDTNSLDGAHMRLKLRINTICTTENKTKQRRIDVTLIKSTTSLYCEWSFPSKWLRSKPCLYVKMANGCKTRNTVYMYADMLSFQNEN